MNWQELCRIVLTALHLGSPSPPKITHLVPSLDKILETPAPYKEWHCNSGGCVRYTRQLYLALEAAEPGRWQVIYARPLEQAMIVAGRPMHVIMGHQFLVEKSTSGTDQELIIDTTVRQFFAESRRHRIPSIFVGTRQALLDLYRAHAKYIEVRSSQLPDPIVGKVDPDEFVRVQYGFTGGRIDETYIVRTGQDQ